jgi:hypothetical protein
MLSRMPPFLSVQYSTRSYQLIDEAGNEFSTCGSFGSRRRYGLEHFARLMFFAEAQIRVHLYGQPTDMRKSYDGLQALARHTMGRDPLDGALYIFVNRRGSQLKCLYFDRSGFCIWGKRLETGRFISDWRTVRTREADGYAAYKQYAEKTGIHDALCWSHPRRGFFEALTAEPTGAAEALEQIKALYAVEDQIRDRKLIGEAKQLHRFTHSKPLVVQLFFKWVDGQLARQGFTPSNPSIQALNYVRERRVGLEIFLADPDVPIDTNHLERALHVVPMGRKNRNFCWTELGAKHVGIIQSCIAS